MSFKQWVKTPKGYMLILLIMYVGVIYYWTHSVEGLKTVVFAVGVAVCIDYITNLIVERRRFMPDGAAITGLMIGMILSTTVSWAVILLTTIISILSKYMIVISNKHVFNPAAFGLLLSILFFNSEQSWWGAFGDLPGWANLLLVAGGYIIMYRVNKAPQVYAYFSTLFLIFLAMGIFHYGDAFDAFRPPFINSALFFGLFMLTDPPGSPAKTRDQIIFGMITAIVGGIIYAKYGGLMYLFIGLLVGNLFHLLMRFIDSKRVNTIHSVANRGSKVLVQKRK